MGQRSLLREPSRLKPCVPSFQFISLPRRACGVPVGFLRGSCGVEPRLTGRKRSTNNPGSPLSAHHSCVPLVVQWTLGSPERYLMFTKRHFDGRPCLLMLRDIISSAEPPRRSESCWRIWRRGCVSRCCCFVCFCPHHQIRFRPASANEHVGQTKRRRRALDCNRNYYRLARRLSPP